MSFAALKFLYFFGLVVVGVTVRFFVAGRDEANGVRVIGALVAGIAVVIALNWLIGPLLAEPTTLYGMTGNISTPEAHETQEFLRGLPLASIAAVTILGPSFLRRLRHDARVWLSRKAEE